MFPENDVKKYKAIKEYTNYCYPPHSKYLLCKNLMLHFIMMIAPLTILTYLLLYPLNAHDGPTLYDWLGALLLFVLVSSIKTYDIWDEWKHGRYYKEYIKHLEKQKKEENENLQ